MTLELGSMSLNDLIGGTIYYDYGKIDVGIIMDISLDTKYNFVIITTDKSDRPYKIPYENNKLFSSCIDRIRLEEKDLFFRYGN